MHRSWLMCIRELFSPQYLAAVAPVLLQDTIFATVCVTCLHWYVDTACGSLLEAARKRSYQFLHQLCLSLSVSRATLPNCTPKLHSSHHLSALFIIHYPQAGSFQQGTNIFATSPRTQKQQIEIFQGHRIFFKLLFFH